MYGINSGSVLNSGLDDLFYCSVHNDRPLQFIIRAKNKLKLGAEQSSGLRISKSMVLNNHPGCPFVLQKSRQKFIQGEICEKVRLSNHMGKK